MTIVFAGREHDVADISEFTTFKNLNFVSPCISAQRTLIANYQYLHRFVAETIVIATCNSKFDHNVAQRSDKIFVSMKHYPGTQRLKGQCRMRSG